MPDHFFGLECRDHMPKFYWNLHIMLVNMDKIWKNGSGNVFFHYRRITGNVWKLECAWNIPS